VASKERERQIARERYQRQLERKQQQRRRMRQNGIIAATVVAVLGVIGALVVLARTGDDKPTLTTSPKPTASSAPATATSAPGSNGFCAAAPAKPAQPQHYSAEPRLTVDRSATYRARLDTNCGALEAELFAAKAPHTVNSFAFLASKGYFNGVPCHRVTSQGIYVLQCGDPTGTGSGGPGYQFTDENLDAFGKAGSDGTVTYPAGTLAMANAGPGTNGSQFFIVYKDSPLAPNYTPFGRITGGLPTVARIADGGSEPPGDGAPKIHVSLTKVTITKR
jgi:peptidyl-prolyl cis-trans isomerase B (cyclophilin B)